MPTTRYTQRRDEPKPAQPHPPSREEANADALDPDREAVSDQDIDTAGTDADPDPLTRPKAATALPRRSSAETGGAEAGSPTKSLGTGIAPE